MRETEYYGSMPLDPSDFLRIMERGGWVMWPMLALSVISFAFALERAWFWWNLHRPRRVERYRALLVALRAGQRDKIESIIAKDDDLYSELAKRMLDEGSDDAIAMECVEDVRPRIDRFMNIFSTTITAAPMLGILGTVTGIIQSFDLLGGVGGGGVDPRDVSSGIGEALITTASGLAVALATLFPYMFFRAQAERALGRLESLIAAAKIGLGPVRNWSTR